MDLYNSSFLDAFDFVQSKLFINQMKKELFHFHSIIEDYLPKVSTVLEIGNRNGGNLCLFARFLDRNGMLIGIDPEEITPLDVPLISSIVLPVTFKFIKGRSQDYTIFDQIIHLVENRGIDILFIDGDHTYEAVKSDYEMYAPLVNHPGLIIFHDIGGFESSNPDWPANFWFKELRKHKPYIEIVSNPPICGLGILPV